MRLMATDINPVPPDAIIEAVTTQDRRMLRAARWAAPYIAAHDFTPRGTVLLCQGRSSKTQNNCL